MGKIDNEKYKAFKEAYIPFHLKKAALIETSPYRFRLDQDLYHLALDLYGMMSEINVAGVYSSNWIEFYRMAYEVTVHVGLSKLRMNHRWWDGDHEYIPGDEFNPAFLREEVVSDEEIVSSVNFLWLAMDYLQKASPSFPRKKDFCVRVNRIYHNLDEAYRVIGDEPKRLEVLEAASKNFDIRSLESLSRHYIEAENYSYEQILRVFELCVDAANEQVEWQKALGISNWNEDRKRFEKGELRLLEIRNNEGLDLLHIPLVSTMANLVNSLIHHSFYDKGLELAETTKSLCSRLSIWDGRYEQEYIERVSRWERLKQINEQAIAPSDDVLAPFFSTDTLRRMHPEIKILMGTSLYVFSCFRKHADFTLDYSPATISLFKAIEHILYKMAITEFYPYLVANSTSFNRVFASPLIYDRTNKVFHLPDTFSIGIGLGVFVYKSLNNRPLLNTAVKEFLSSFGIVDGEAKMLQFFNDVENCRVYRNITAHRERVTRESAEEAREMILETAKIIENAYSSFGGILGKQS